MKNMIKYILFLSIFYFGLLVVCYAAKGENFSNSKAYEYPIKPGTSEWKKLRSHKEMVEVLQIPASDLKNMSTEDLYESVINYPLWGDIFAYDNLQTGFNAVCVQFNGLQELVARKQAGKILLKKYQKFNPVILLGVSTAVQQSRYTKKLLFLELILCQDKLIDKLSISERKVLLWECVKKGNLESSRPDIYKQFDHEVITLLIAGKIIRKDNIRGFKSKTKNNKKLNRFLLSGICNTTSDLKSFKKEIKKFFPEI